MRIYAALHGVLESKRAILPSILLSGSRQRLVGAPHSPADFEPAVRVAHPYSELEGRKTRLFPTCPARCGLASLPWPGWRTPRARIWDVGARRELRVDRMADTVGEKVTSHHPRPLVTGRNLPQTKGCRSSECGGEQESRHGFRDRWRGRSQSGCDEQESFGD